MEQSALHHRFRGRITVFLKQMVLQRAGVYPDPNRDAAFLTSFNNGLNLLSAADVARINPDLVDAVFDCQQRQLVVEVNVRNQRDMNPFLDFLDRRSRFLIVHRHAYQLATRFLQPEDFRDCRFNVRCFRRTHALNDNFVAAADRQIPDFDRPRILSQECHVWSLP
ncbi:hypothetical protein D3C74_392480 [compost metagenome]